MVTVTCPHTVECNATFLLGIPNGVEQGTLRLYTPAAWAELRKTAVPKPLTGQELALLQLQNDLTGLSTVDVRRLVADNLRLRQLGIDAEADTMDHPAQPKSEIEPDASKPLTDVELAEFERAAVAFHQALHSAAAKKDPGNPAIESSFALISLRLVAEVRRLRERQAGLLTWLRQFAGPGVCPIGCPPHEPHYEGCPWPALEAEAGRCQATGRIDPFTTVKLTPLSGP
jgi:hypothetical protein